MIGSPSYAWPGRQRQREDKAIVCYLLYADVVGLICSRGAESFAGAPAGNEEGRPVGGDVCTLEHIVTVAAIVGTLAEYIAAGRYNGDEAIEGKASHGTYPTAGDELL
jgi:hypothetical protein